MGAHVVPTDIPGKVGALQLGVQFAAEQLKSRSALFIDGDVLVPSTWAGQMYGRLKEAHADAGLAIFGSAVFVHGKSRITDTLRTARFLMKSAQAARSNSEPLITGQNMAINFAGNQAAWDSYMSIDPRLFVGDDMAIHDRVRDTGMVISAQFSLGSLVLTRGDRFSSVRELLQEQRNRWSTKRAFYAEQYGEDVVAYSGLR